MSSPNTTLNYVGFFMLYVICFVFMYKKMAGIIALGSLTIIHTAATLFIGNEVSNKLINGQLDGTSYHPFVIISLISILIASGLNAVGLILIMLMVIELQKKYNDTVGTPINLPPDRENDYNQFKLNMIIIFGIVCVLLYFILFKPELIHHKFGIRLFTTLLLSISIVIISIYQLKYATSLSKLPVQSIVGR